MFKTNPNSIKLKVLKIFGLRRRKLVSNLELILEKWKKLNSICVGRGLAAKKNVPGLRGGTIFWGDFLLRFCAIWKNDPFSKSENVPGLKPRLPRRLRGPCVLELEILKLDET